MARYVYRCDPHGRFELDRPIGTATPTIACPTCGTASGRVFTAPMLGRADRTRRALIDRTEATAATPAVVSALPPRPTPSRGAAAPRLDPRTRTLPRP